MNRTGLPLDAHQYIAAEIHAAHNALDVLGIPRVIDGDPLTIAQRCQRVVKVYLHETSTLRLRLIDGSKK